MSTALLFLDIDGVLNNEESFRRRHESAEERRRNPEGFADECVAELGRVIAATDCELVLSSTWRMFRSRQDAPARALGDIFRRLGLRRWPEPTPILHTSRGCEIAAYLAARTRPYSGYAIIDDDRDMLPEQLPYFVQTDGRLGLQAADADRLIAILTAADARASA